MGIKSSVPQSIIKLIDEAWGKNLLEYKKEETPDNSFKEFFRIIVVKIKNEPEKRFALTSEEYDAFRELQINVLGIGAKNI